MSGPQDTQIEFALQTSFADDLVLARVVEGLMGPSCGFA